MMSWEELEKAGWVRRISEKNKRVTYGRPREGGRVMIVTQRRELREGEEGLADILWPPGAFLHLTIQVTIEIDANGILVVSAEEKGTDTRRRSPSPTTRTGSPRRTLRR